MIWISTTIYFLVISIVLWAAFYAYGESLLYLGQFGSVVKTVSGGVVYILFSVLIVMPLLLAFIAVDEWRLEFQSNHLYMVFLLLMYAFSFLPGGLFFRKKYLERLRSLGYFSRRK